MRDRNGNPFLAFGPKKIEMDSPTPLFGGGMAKIFVLNFNFRR
jgi:hypothetical protein